MIKFTNEDLIKDVSKETGLPVEQIRNVSLDMWHFIKMYLQHAENYFYKGIKIENGIKIPVNPKRILDRYETISQNWKGTDHQIRITKFHKLLLDNDCYTQRQKTIATKLTRPELFLAGIEGNNLYGEESE